ncbi:hypothetical protein EDB92DRAFT_1945881 [Lactarius akahatsu]|uniref:Ankyrin n=1 Tax=Lactarius akahatsu TaxID=416441 RepID=A0AAD4LFI0_9AGAM|nr:hypothetical protein EDB92DRAFT_1945881 [Lactarius akahatsu]
MSPLPDAAAPEPIQAPDLPDSPAGDAWSQYRAYLAAVLPHSKAENADVRSLARAAPHAEEYHTHSARGRLDSKDELFGLRRVHSACPWHSDARDSPGIWIYTPRKGRDLLPSRPILKVFYDELYEACWKGDNVSIRELCLPKRNAEGEEPIQIVVQTTAVGDSNPFTSWMSSFTVQLWHHRNGWTPFLVALHRRHWDTARLVLAIAMAQYQPPDTDIDASTSITQIQMMTNTDEHDYGEQKPINFTDIAARPSSVRTDVPPKKMLEVETVFLQAGHKHVTCNPLQKAIVDDDFEAFLLDRPEMLDELIRRSGVGIPIPSKAVKGSAVVPKASEERVYLGLKVGGKRRADLAKHKQAQRKALTYNYNLLRSAIGSGATKIVDYLAGPRPIAAFIHYVETHNDDIVQYLTGIDNLGAVLPDLLGWKPDELNESPLLCAVIDDRIDVLKQLFTLKPNLMEEALHLRVRFIVDLLLEKGCDPSERDFRGWNIYHLACLSPDNRRVKFVEYLLKTLPEELTHELMAQTSKEAVNTPLMLAVKHENAATVRIILEFGIDPGILLLRDADWSTPLHVAVQNADTVLAEVLLKYGPTQLLYAENSAPRFPTPTELSMNIWRQLFSPPKGPPLFDVEKQKTEIPRLRATLDTLLADGLLVDGAKLTTELFAFAGRMEGRLAMETAQKNAADEGELDSLEPQGSTARTYFALRDAAAARPGTRQLVHMVDVQRSVQRNLARQDDGILVRWSERSRENDDEDKKPDPEKQRIAELKARSLLASGSRGGFDLKQVDLYSEDKL